MCELQLRLEYCKSMTNAKRSMYYISSVDVTNCLFSMTLFTGEMDLSCYTAKIPSKTCKSYECLYVMYMNIMKA